MPNCDGVGEADFRRLVGDRMEDGTSGANLGPISRGRVALARRTAFALGALVQLLLL